MQYSQTTKSNLSLLKSEVRSVFETLLNECYKRGINAQISESLRTAERQLELYNKGQSKAREAYESLHFYGLACDIFVNNNGKYDLSRNAEIWKICQELELDKNFGMRWGGNFISIKDEPHFELSWGKSWCEFKKDYERIKNTKINTPVQTLTLSNTMSNPLLQTLKNKGIDIFKETALDAVSFVPIVGPILSKLGKNLLGNENANEDEVIKAVQNTDAQKLSEILAEKDIEVEKTKQFEIKKEIKGMDFVINFFDILSSKTKATQWFIAYLIYFHIALGITLWYCSHSSFEHDELMTFIHRCILIIMVSAPITPLALIFKPIYNIIEAMSESITAIAKLPKGIIGIGFKVGDIVNNKLTNQK